ncbi:MAG TPA: hypothetical protein VFQ31_06070 [Methyloceanibacter sp.]|nr:hypothetical protein [Methyloceanibacter sp.]
MAGFLATFITSPQKEIVTALERMKKIVGRERGTRILGVHLEGPFVHVERKGAHNPGYIRPSSLKEVREWIAAVEGLVKLVTLAPEIPGQEAVSDSSWRKAYGSPWVTRQRPSRRQRAASSSVRRALRTSSMR